MELLNRLNQKGMTIIMVTHSPDCAGYAQRIMRVSDGKLVGENSNVRSLDRWHRKERKKESLPSQNQATAAIQSPG
jgi:ABC-type lipoprotein export system ATPase subunit